MKDYCRYSVGGSIAFCMERFQDRPPLFCCSFVDRIYYSHVLLNNTFPDIMRNKTI